MSGLHELGALLRRGVLYGSRHGWQASAERLAALIVDRRFPSAGSYENWLARRSPETGDVLADAPGAGRDGAQLVVSVLVPVKDPAPEHLAQLARSVLDQDHPATELVLADDGCVDGRVLALMAELARSDPRVVRVAAGGVGISGATNAAAQASRGQVLAFADHDDLLAPGVLSCLARAFASEASLDLAFTDEDMLDERGRRVAPSFRPGPSPWLALGFNCACHLLAVRRELFERLGGLRGEFDGAQDHDLLLRALEQARTARHLDLLGYHWRRSPGSVASTFSAKPWAYEAGRRAVSDACRRRGLHVAAVEPGAIPGVYRVQPEPHDARRPVRLLLHGPRCLADRWRRARLPGLELESVFVSRWPARSSEAPLLVVDAATRPAAEPLRRALSWLAQPGLMAVAGVTLERRCRTNLGFAVERGGVAQAVAWRRPARGVGPGLLGAAPREVAAGGEQLLALDARCAAWWPAGRSVSRPDLLTAGLMLAARGAPLLLDPQARLRIDARSGASPCSSDLRASRLWPLAREALADGFWTQDGADPWCPRHELLKPLGLPGPLHRPV